MRSEDGFSLVELLVAIALFGLVLTAVAGAFISSLRSISDQRLRTAATRVASDHLETLRGLPFDELDARAGLTIATTPDGRTFTIDTEITAIDAATGGPMAGGRVKQITATVGWTVPGGAGREVSHTTAIADDPGPPTVTQVVGTVSMFPSPATTDASGRPLDDIEVTVPLQGFSIGTLVDLAWVNADGTAGAETLTSTTGLNWRGTIAKEKVLARLVDGRGDIEFNLSAGALHTVHGLTVQEAVATQPAITGATIDRNPIVVAPKGTRSCDDRNQCENTADITFTTTATGLNPEQDSVILQYQLYDGTFREVPLTPTAGQWQLTVRQRTTKFLTGTAREFRFTAIRSADGAAATATVVRQVTNL